MTDLGSLLADAKVDLLQKVVSNGRQKFLCYTKSKDSKAWVVEVTDGVDVWLLELDENGMEAQKDLNGVNSIDAFFTRFSVETFITAFVEDKGNRTESSKTRNGFLAGDISVSRMGNKLTLSVGKGASALELDLFEAKAAAEKRSELQHILFRLAENCSQLEIQLSAANRQIDTLKAQKSSAGGLDALMDLSPKKGGGANKAKPKKVGVVNPSNRKRKAATGVVFEGD